MSAEETYIVAAVKVAKAMRFYTARSSQEEACERELAQQGLKLLLWAEGETEEAALEMALKQVALQQIAERVK